MNCQTCGRDLHAGQRKCVCGWKAIEDDAPVIRICHFRDDHKCKGKSDLRVNDKWLCNWHYENFYDQKIRTGEIIQPQELKFKKRLEIVAEEVVKIVQKTHDSIRGACLSILKDHGISVPKQLTDENP